MKKLFILAISFTMIFCLFIAVVPASAASVKTTTDFAVDTNVYKGDYIQDDNNPVDSVIVWVDVKGNKFDETLEYGTFIYSSCKDSDIVFENGSFNPAPSGKSTFATRFDTTQLVKGVEYAIKAYEKDGEYIRLSKTTAYFNANDAETKKFDIFLQGPNITYEDQDTISNYAQNQVNTQYLIYRDNVLMGATNEFKYNLVDDLFDEEGNYEETSYDVTVKTISGLNNGGESNEFSFEMQTIEDESSFLENVGTDVENVGADDDTDLSIKPKNVYQILACDIDFTDVTFKTWTIEDGNFKSPKTLQSIIRYYADTLDARGHTIKLKYDCDKQAQNGSQVAGLIGKFCETGFVRNLNYEAEIIYNYTETYNEMYYGGHRACGFTMVGFGSYENCVMKAKMQALYHTPDMNSLVRRDAFVGFPGNYTATNMLVNIELLNSEGDLIGDVRTHDGGKANYGTHFHWESLGNSEANQFIMVAPATMLDTNATVGPRQGKNITHYKSFDDVLTGTNGMNLDQEGLSSMDKGEYRDDVVYNTGWDENIWEFNDEEGYIKFYDNIVYSREVIE